MHIGAATAKSSMEGPQILKNGTTLRSSNSTSGYKYEETQNTNSKEYMHPYVHFNIIYNSQDMEETQVPISRWVDKKLWYMYTMEHYSSIEKKEILPCVTAWVVLTGITLSDISQSEKDKYHMISLICRI